MTTAIQRELAREGCCTRTDPCADHPEPETYTSPADYLTKRLRRELKDLDAHEKETRRLLDEVRRTGIYHPPGMMAWREDTHRNLVARVVETARALAVVLP